MKLITTIFILVLLTSSQSFSQDGIQRGVIPERPIVERIREMHKPNADDLEGLNSRESLLLKSKSSRWQTELRNQNKEFYEEGFNAKDVRTTINKTLLSNGFLVIEEFYQYWDDSTWANVDKWSYTYNGNNQLTEQISQTWYGAWVNYGKSSYTYDGNNNLTEQIIQTWAGFWKNYGKFTYTYDGNNNQTEFLNEIWNGSAWLNFVKQSFTYDGNNNQTEYLDQSWNGSAWVNEVKSSYTYDGNNNKTELLYQEWNGSAWVNLDKYSYTYDGNNKLIEELYQTWNASAWVNKDKNSYTYDVNNNQTEALYQTWDGSAWVNVARSSYTFAPVTAVNEDISSVNTFSLSNNYPNPFNPSTKITYTIPERTNVSLKIFDLLGSEVAELVKGEVETGNYIVSFDASSLPSGIYFYRLQAGSLVETKKMILMK